MAGWWNDRFSLGIAIGVLFGIAARLLMLRTDYRQYPTYPHGQIIHIALGVIAAGLGAVAVPALLHKEYTAVTFLGLAAQQFRDVRKMERDTLSNLDEMELIPRGGAYIEGIAMVFEGRNYLVILASFCASLGTILGSWAWGAAAGLVMLIICQVYKSGSSIARIAQIEKAEVKVEGPNLYIDDIYMMNVGLEDTRRKIIKHGMGFVLRPVDKNCRVSLANLGQRQAILHNLAVIMGVYRDSGEPSLLPIGKLDLEDGRLGIFFLTADPDEDKALEALRRVPLLENAVRMPSERPRRKGAAR